VKHTTFIRLLQDDDSKQTQLAEAIRACEKGTYTAPLFLIDPKSFGRISGSPFAYWLSQSCRSLFQTLPPLEGGGREVRVGDHPGDGFRFLRLFWEVPQPSQLDWRNYQKGGDFSPFYYDIHLVADWDEHRQTYRGFQGRPGRPNERPSNYQYFFRPGITWPRRSQRGLSVRVLPAGCVFADKGPVVFGERSELLAILALLNSAAFKGLLALQMAFGSYETGAMQRTVIPELEPTSIKLLTKIANDAIASKRDADTVNETSHAFVVPALLRFDLPLLRDRIAELSERERVRCEILERCQRRLDDLSFQLYGIDGNDRSSIEEMIGVTSEGDSEATDQDGDEGDAPESSCIPERLVSALVSYVVGAIYGRWDFTLSLHAERTGWFTSKGG